MEILNQFGVKPILLLAQAVNFFILLFILKKVLYKPLLGMLETRRKKIEESLKNAEEIEKRLTEISNRETEAIQRSAREGEKIIRQAGEQATQIINDAKIKVEGMINHAAQESRRISQLEKTRVEMEIKENLSDIVLLVLEKVTRKVITTKQQKEIISREVKNLS